MTCERRPHIVRERGRVSNPSMPSDDGDNVLTQTTHSVRARQGVELVNDKRR